MHFEPETHRNAVTRIHRLAGRFTSFEKMLLTNDAYDISIQLLAMQGSFNQFTVFMHDAFRMDINLKLHTPLPPTFQTPEHLQYIENTKVQLISCSLQQLLQIMYALKQKKIFPE